MKTILIILNENHSLLPDQEYRLAVDFAGFTPEVLHVPAAGWTIEQIKTVVEFEIGNLPVVFASPIPAMILLLAGQRAGVGVYVFHNDRRVAREFPMTDGTIKVVHTVAPDGWQIV
jgi:hypothetical protein